MVLHLSKRALTHHCPLRILVLALQLLSLLLQALPPMLSVPPCWLPELLLPKTLLLLLSAAPPVVWVPLSLLSTLLRSTSLPNCADAEPADIPAASGDVGGTAEDAGGAFAATATHTGSPEAVVGA